MGKPHKCHCEPPFFGGEAISLSQKIASGEEQERPRNDITKITS
jgi:hypothetical protein